MLQIDPSNGVSDPARFPCPLEEDAAITVELRQDDDLFHAMGVGIGSLGIAYAVMLQAVDLFWLREERTVTTWEALTAEGGFLERLVARQGKGLENDLYHYQDYPKPDPHPVRR